MAMEEGVSKEKSWCCLLHSTKSVREDLLPCAGCKICVAKAAALNRIKAAGGDSVKAAKDSASRAGADTLLVESAVKPAEVVKKTTMMVPQAYIDELLIDPQIFPLRPLSEDFFQRNPNLREISLAGAATVLLSIEHDENILFQYFRRGSP